MLFEIIGGFYVIKYDFVKQNGEKKGKNGEMKLERRRTRNTMQLITKGNVRLIFLHD